MPRGVHYAQSAGPSRRPRISRAARRRGTRHSRLSAPSPAAAPGRTSARAVPPRRGAGGGALRCAAPLCAALLCAALRCAAPRCAAGGGGCAEPASAPCRGRRAEGAARGGSAPRGSSFSAHSSDLSGVHVLSPTFLSPSPQLCALR